MTKSFSIAAIFFVVACVTFSKANAQSDYQREVTRSIDEYNKNKIDEIINQNGLDRTHLKYTLVRIYKDRGRNDLYYYDVSDGKKVCEYFLDPLSAQVDLRGCLAVHVSGTIAKADPQSDYQREVTRSIDEYNKNKIDEIINQNGLDRSHLKYTLVRIYKDRGRNDLYYYDVSDGKKVCEYFLDLLSPQVDLRGCETMHLDQ